jgi:preprotein translocase subunit SecG
MYILVFYEIYKYMNPPFLQTILIIIQIIVSFGVCNVWIIRKNKPSQYRGGSQSRTLKEEFQAYGLSDNLRNLVGFLKLSFASLLLLGIWIPSLTKISALGIAILMIGAISMHAKISDPLSKSIPALSMLIMTLFIVLFA